MTLAAAPPTRAKFPLEELAQILHSHLSSGATPRMQEQQAEEAQLQEIEQALNAPGRTIVIYGDAGVGKRSLATEIATHQADHDTLAVASNTASTFSVVFHRGLRRNEDPTLKESQEDKRAGPGKLTTAELERNTVFALVSKAGEDTLVVIDEFSAITSDAERARFSEFVRQISNLRLPIRFIFSGVSEGLKALLGAHESRYDYCENKGPSNKSEASFQILDSPGDALKEQKPHYVHLLSEELFWDMLYDPTFAGSLR